VGARPPPGSQNNMNERKEEGKRNMQTGTMIDHVTARKMAPKRPCEE